MEDSEHWMSQLRKFIGTAVREFEEHRKVLSSTSINLEEAQVLSDMPSSAWVDGGSGQIDFVGGSIFVVRAAAGYFANSQSIEWQTDMKVGFTTLPRDVDRYVGIQRNILELETIIELLSQKPEFAVLDNSLASYATMGVPHSILRFFSNPQYEDSPEYDYFRSFMMFMKRFDVLIRECQSQDIALIGAAKDSKSRVYSQKLGLGRRMNDSVAIAIASGNQTGFTKPIDAHYLVVKRVQEYLERKTLLTENRGEFLTSFGILKPQTRVFRLDFLKSQKDFESRIKEFLTTMHDGGGYLIPSHIVHNKATISHKLLEDITQLVTAKIAKENMGAARFVFGTQRRSRFG